MQTIRQALSVMMLGSCAFLTTSSHGSDLTTVDSGEVHPTDQQELSGRDPILEEFLSQHPDHPLAHWSDGEVWTGEEWLKYDRIVDQGERWRQVYLYREERDKLEDNFRNNLFLADGCREHELYAEERAHLVRVLLADYSFHEAHQRLGHIQRNGFWITPEQIRRAYNEHLRTEENLKQWSAEVERLQTRLSQSRPDSLAEEKWIAELHNIKTPDVIPALERFLASKGPRETRIYQDWLSNIDSHEAAEALARQSVFLDSSELRTRAAKLLHERRLETFVPYLLNGMTTVQTEFTLEFMTLVGRYPLWPLKVFTEKVRVDGFGVTLTTTGTTQVIEGNQRFPISGIRLKSGRLLGGRDTLYSQRQAPKLFEYASAGISDTIMANYGQQALESSQTVRNDRIMRTLSTATEEELKTSDEWFDWWSKYNDLQFLGGKLILNDQYNNGTWYVDKRGGSAQATFRASSCFTGSTIIETEHGQRPVKEIQVGDRVLSQDIETGELTFKPIFDRPVRKDAETVNIKVADDEIQCSLGHPFWIPGLGWRMAKELEVGMPLLTLEGQRAEIQEITPARKETVYNLVVADFSTYFVSKHRFLTHDVTPREATDMVSPGIRKKFE